MKYLLFSFLLLLSLSSFCQQTGNVKYFRDKYFVKEVPADKARFKIVTTLLEGGISRVESYSVNPDVLIDSKFFKNNKPTGIWKDYDKHGKLVSERNFDSLIYSDAKIEGGNYFEFDGSKEVEFVEPYYIDSTDQFYYTYLKKNVRFPKEAIEAGIQGTVYVHVRISMEGILEVLSIYKSADPLLDVEIWRVLDHMTGWTPAMKEGKAIDSYTIIPMKFILQ
jgi:hypothetical protein